MLKWLWISVVVLLMDQLSKWMAVAYLEERVPEAILPHLNFTLAYNYGAAFSFLGDQGGWQRWFFVIISFVVSGYIVYWLRKLDKSERWTAVSLALVLGGALGNTKLQTSLCLLCFEKWRTSFVCWLCSSSWSTRR